MVPVQLVSFVVTDQKHFFFYYTAVLTYESALRHLGLMGWGRLQQGLQTLRPLWNPFGVPVAAAEHLHGRPHGAVDLTHG